MDLNAYKKQILNLFPRGIAWPRQPNLMRDKVIEGYAAELVRADTRVRNMLREADPRTAIETLEDWERVAGLPDECVIPSSMTIQERRARVVQRLTSTGSQSIGYFKDLATEMGYDVEIIEYRPFLVGESEVGLVEKPSGAGSTLIFGLTELLDLRLYWKIEVDGPRVTWFTVSESELGKDYLGKIDFATDLECVINKLKPAHTVLIFSYEG